MSIMTILKQGTPAPYAPISWIPLHSKYRVNCQMRCRIPRLHNLLLSMSWLPCQTARKHLSNGTCGVVCTQTLPPSLSNPQSPSLARTTWALKSISTKRIDKRPKSLNLPFSELHVHHNKRRTSNGRRCCFFNLFHVFSIQPNASHCILIHPMAPRFVFIKWV